MKIKNVILTLFTATLLMACSGSDDGSDGGGEDDFNRKALLENAADNIIIPALTDLELHLNDLSLSKDAFMAAPSQLTLDQLREDWLSAYLVWQHVEMFNIGKAEEIQYAFQMNIYPTNVLDINNNIGAGTYDLSSVNNHDAVGFPALDYLLYGTGANDQEILDYYTTATNASARLQYLNDLVEQMNALTATVLNDWRSDYRSTFVNSTGNTASSSVNLLINDFIFYYEKGLRANKIGIPAGVFSTTPFPEKVEAYYNGGVSKMLAMEALDAVDDFFNGRAYDGMGSGSSYASYATYLRDNSGAEDLTTVINNQLAQARARMENLDNDLSAQINTNNQMMTMTYDALQQVVVSLKVDLLQTLNVSVDYVDADGD